MAKGWNNDIKVDTKDWPDLPYGVRLGIEVITAQDEATAIAMVNGSRFS